MNAGLLVLDTPRHLDKSDIKDVDVSDAAADDDDDIEILITALEKHGQEETSEGAALIASELEQGQIIDVLLPPFRFIDDKGNNWLTRVSRRSPSRSAVIQLWEKLDMKLIERQARPDGICSVRATLFDECFDELIRQVTLDCPERGLLLARVRDEAQMTLTAFQSLCESASEFGACKAIQAESGASELEAELEQLDMQVAEMEAEVRRMEAWRRQVSRRIQERRTVQAALASAELETLQRSEKQYQLLLETLLANKTTVQP